MRNKKHYENLLASNPNASVGFTLAAQAVYAAKYGQYITGDTGREEYRNIARCLKQKYGEVLSTDEVRLEMEAKNDE